jgi:CarD family transcriptional regulator
MLLAEVLRDLTRDIEDGERSYSERIIYETAINRLASEYSAIYGIDFEEAKDKVTLTAKDKLNSEGKVIQKDEFDEFEIDGIERDEEDEESEDEDEEDEDGDDDYDDYDDDKPKKRKKR